jgi:hypothetical protein
VGAVHRSSAGPSSGSFSAPAQETLFWTQDHENVAECLREGGCLCRTTDAGPVVVRFVGITDGKAVFSRQDVVVESNKTRPIRQFEAWKPPYDFKLPNGERDNDRHKKLLNTLLV